MFISDGRGVTHGSKLQLRIIVTLKLFNIHLNAWESSSNVNIAASILAEVAICSRCAVKHNKKRKKRR